VWFVGNRTVGPCLQVVKVTRNSTGAEIAAQEVLDSADLVSGLTVLLDGPPNSALVDSCPVLGLIIHLPYILPSNPPPDAKPIGTIPITVHGRVGSAFAVSVLWLEYQSAIS
jgi:hypothetical protein